MTEAVLRHFCTAVGIDYQDTMINWRPIPDSELPQLQAYGSYYKTAMETNKFLSSTPKQVVSSDQLSDKVIAAVDKAMPFYLKLRELRYIPDV